MTDTNLNGVSPNDLANALPETDEEILFGKEEELPEEEGAEESVAPETDEQNESEPDDGFVEAEYEGKTYKVPAELKDALLRNADYTRKTQEVAELRRATEQREQTLRMVQHAMDATFDKAVELRELQSRLAQFDQFDWQAMASQDPTETTKLNLAYQQIQRQAAEKQAELQQAYSQQHQLEAQRRQQILQIEAQRLKQSLPAFNEEMAARIRETARSGYGITDAELDSLADARYVQILHDAMQWRSLQNKKPQAMKKVAEAPRVIKPQGSAQRPRNQAALQRLKASGRVEDLAALL